MVHRVSRRITILCASAASLALAGCQTYRAQDTNQFYHAIGYAPAAGGGAGEQAPGCGDGFAVERVSSDLPTTGAKQFRVTPGMTLQVRQGQGRLSGASEAPVMTSWSWRVPTSRQGACGRLGGWTASDLTVLRTLVHGARLNDGTAPEAKKANLWLDSVRCAIEGGTFDQCGVDPQSADSVVRAQGTAAATVWARDRLEANLLNPFVQNLVFELRKGEPPPSLGETNGAAQAIAAECLDRLEDFGVTPAFTWSQISDCLDPAKLQTGSASALACERAHKRLLSLGRGKTPLASPPLELLTTGDALGLVQPRTLTTMASPAFDLTEGKPGGGGGDVPSQGRDVQTPLAGQAYQGFIDIDLRIPVRISSFKEPVLVSVCTTAGALAKSYGGRVERIGRLPGWMPAKVGVIQPVVAGGTVPVAKLTSADGRVYLRFGDRPSAAEGVWLNAAAVDDLLIAPGDLIVLKYR